MLARAGSGWLLRVVPDRCEGDWPYAMDKSHGGPGSMEAQSRFVHASALACTFTTVHAMIRSILHLNSYAWHLNVSYLREKLAYLS